MEKQQFSVGDKVQFQGIVRSLTGNFRGLLPDGRAVVVVEGSQWSIETELLTKIKEG
jgi:hypothetical protein